MTAGAQSTRSLRSRFRELVAWVIVVKVSRLTPARGTDAGKSPCPIGEIPEAARGRRGSLTSKKQMGEPLLKNVSGLFGEG